LHKNRPILSKVKVVSSDANPIAIPFARRNLSIVSGTAKHGLE
jgi:hypothetical protein